MNADNAAGRVHRELNHPVGRIDPVDRFKHCVRPLLRECRKFPHAHRHIMLVIIGDKAHFHTKRLEIHRGFHIAAIIALADHAFEFPLLQRIIDCLRRLKDHSQFPQIAFMSCGNASSAMLGRRQNISTAASPTSCVQD